MEILQGEELDQDGVKVGLYEEDSTDIQINYGSGLCWLVIPLHKAIKLRNLLNKIFEEY